MDQTAEHGGEPNTLDTGGLCLLSLDGGGIRGFSTLFILKNIMRQLNRERKVAGPDPVKPCEVFDLIGGTSTGGLIAIMLGRLEMSVDECIEAYSELAKKVFRKKLRSRSFSLTGKVKSRYDSQKLESAFREIVKKKCESEDALFNDHMERGCKTFVCASDRMTRHIVRLRSYDGSDSDISATICQVALATSAAVTFFDPVRIGNRSFADGGLGANNPADEVEGEAQNMWCESTGDLKPLVKCFISIGTGNPGIKPYKFNVFKFLTKTVTDIALETESTEKKFIARWAQHFEKHRYFRINVDQGLQNIGLEEYKKQGEIEAATEFYMTNHDRKTRVRDCVQNLKLKERVVDEKVVTSIREYNRKIQTQSGNIKYQILFSLKGVPMPDHYVPRPDEMKQLVEFFQHSIQSSRREVFVVHGIGGIGKTQLCVEFVRAYEDLFSAVVWLDGSSKDALMQSIAETAGLTATISTPPQATPSIKEAGGLLKWLSLPENTRWLLVFDNVNRDWPSKDPQAYDYKDFLPHVDRGNVLITTRLAKLQRPRQHLHLRGANEQLSKKILEDWAGKVLSDTDPERLPQKELLEKLGGLPLALVQAGAYLQSSDMPYKDYLESYNYTWGRLMTDQNDFPLQDYADRSVLTTWKMSYNQVQKVNPQATELLDQWAFLHAGDIWNELALFFLQPSKDKLLFRNLCSFLSQYSLVTATRDVGFSIHPVVHEWCLYNIDSPEEKNRLSAKAISGVATMSALLEEDSSEFVRLEQGQRLLPHARRAARQYLRLEANDNLNFTLAFQLHHVADTINIQESLRETLEWSLIARSIAKEDELRRSALTEDVRRKTKRFHREMRRLSHARRAARQHLPLEDNDNLISTQKIHLHHVADKVKHKRAVTRPVTSATETQDLYLQALKGYIKVNWEDFTSVLDLCHNVGPLFARLGLKERAEQWYSNTLRIEEKAWGRDDKMTLDTVYNLGGLYVRMGKKEKASSLYSQASPGWGEGLDPENFITRETFLKHVKDCADLKKGARRH